MIYFKMWFYLKIVLKSIGKLGILQIFHACKYRWYNKRLSFLSDHWGLGRRRRDKRATVWCPARRDSPAHGLLTIWMIVRKKSYSIDTNYVAIQLTLAKLQLSTQLHPLHNSIHQPCISLEDVYLSEFWEIATRLFVLSMLWKPKVNRAFMNNQRTAFMYRDIWHVVVQNQTFYSFFPISFYPNTVCKIFGLFYILPCLLQSII